ncbi:glucose dehydrogenase [FAD, quinone]-like [Armigeres subalbatus]|uniref:glucose dehydrogenase [FAD, quinone]-like n=1 Tax=Armigeres subalbatus TaxID=124917 RepID=UPI002ED14E94
MLSGIGPKQHLETFGIPVIQALDVGHNLHDHCSYTELNFLLNQTATMVPDRTTAELFQEYITNHTGPFSIPARFESIAFVKTPHSDLPAEYPDLEILLVSTYLNGENTNVGLQLLGLPQIMTDSIFVNFPGHDKFSLFPIIMRPKSRGRISLKSSNPFVPPLMEPNYLSNPHDVTTLIDGMKMVIQIAESQSFTQYGSHLDPTPLAACSHLPFRTDPYWRCAVQQMGKNIHHQAGTCKMGPTCDPTAVVNPELQVHGVSNLRVVDASVIPLPVAGHTNGVVFMIGEKAADMIKRHWARTESC